MTDGDRHVIKGRGPHRGKYLCYARHAATLDATNDGFVWLDDQRKAARWADPKYNQGTWATERARIHNGYFVKLVAPKAVVARVDDLKAYIARALYENALYSHSSRHGWMTHAHGEENLFG